jgi:hypothetical protein
MLKDVQTSVAIDSTNSGRSYSNDSNAYKVPAVDTRPAGGEGQVGVHGQRRAAFQRFVFSLFKINRVERTCIKLLGEGRTDLPELR